MTLRLTPEEYEQIKKRIATRRNAPPEASEPVTEPKPRMNKTEAAYALILRARKTNGEIKWYEFGNIKLRLAALTYYTPDFIMRFDDGTLEAHEVKGFWRDDARVKIKVAARLYPWLRFIAVKKGKQGAWYREVIPNE